MELGLHNIPRFDESVLPYIVQNFETIERAFRALATTLVYNNRYTPGATYLMSSSTAGLNETFREFVVRSEAAQILQILTFDWEGLGTPGAAAVGLPIVDGVSYGAAPTHQAIYAPSGGSGRATITQAWGYSLPTGDHSVGMGTFATVSASYNLYGGHTGQTLVVQENA